MNSKQQTIDTYNKTAKQMAEKFRKIGPRIEDIERGFSLLSNNNPSVLEIGCGDGRDAREILKRTDEYLGIDVSEGMIKVAKEYAPKGKFLVADVDTFVFPKNLDLIFSFASLLHSKKEDVRSIFKRAHQGLNDGGIFYISLKQTNEYCEVSKTDEFGTRTYYHYTPNTIKEILCPGYVVIYEDTQSLRGQLWLTIVLQKLN